MNILKKIDQLTQEVWSLKKYNSVVKDPYAEEDRKAQLGYEVLPRELGPTIRLKKKKKVTEQIDFMVANPHFEIVSDEKVFSSMANFLMSLDPDQLTNEQLQKMVNIFSEIQAEADVDEEVKAKRSRIAAKQYLKKYYSTNKKKIKKKKVELEKSIKGQTRDRMTPIMAKGRKTATGRHKVNYNV